MKAFALTVDVVVSVNGAVYSVPLLSEGSEPSVVYLMDAPEVGQVIVTVRVAILYDMEGVCTLKSEMAIICDGPGCVAEPSPGKALTYHEPFSVTTYPLLETSGSVSVGSLPFLILTTTLP